MRMRNHSIFQISQDVNSLQLIFSRMLMRRATDLKRGASTGGLFSCFSPKPVVKDPQVIDLLSKIITIGSTLHAEVKQLEEINRLMRLRQDLMYREYMERQNNTYAMLWELQMISAELNLLDERNDNIVGKIVKSRPEFAALQYQLDRALPKQRPFSKEILRRHPSLYREAKEIEVQKQRQKEQKASSAEGRGETMMEKIAKDREYESVLPSREVEMEKTISNLVSDINFGPIEAEVPLVSSPEPND